VLHKVNPPDCEDRMKSIYRLQYKVLAFACSTNISSLNDPTIFRRKFGASGEWLYELVKRNGTFNGALTNVITHIACNHGKRYEILQAFLNDTRFHKRLNDNSFRFHYRKLDDKTQQVIGELMELFYDYLLVTGFPINASDNGHRFNRESFGQAFWEANDRMRLCPACDGPKPDSENGKVFSENDHFFPKSKYPFLSVHGSNLLPICKYCNQSFKGAKDPIDDHETEPLRRNFYPYELPAINRINIKVTRSVAGEKVVSLEPSDPDDLVRVVNLRRIVRLETRWIGKLSGTISQLIEDLRELQNYNRRLGEDLKDDFSQLLQARQKFYESTIGRRDGSVLAANYLRFALADPAEIQQLYKETDGSDSH
jgi:hypothetical protein